MPDSDLRSNVMPLEGSVTITITKEQALLLLESLNLTIPTLGLEVEGEKANPNADHGLIDTLLMYEECQQRLADTLEVTLGLVPPDPSPTQPY